MIQRHLSYSDRTGEIAFAVIMVIIINGYVALSDLNTGFIYIVIVNIGACVCWGFIDGFIYAISNSIERNTIRTKLVFLKQIASQKSDLIEKKVLEKVEKRLNDGLFASFSMEGKEAIAKDIVKYSSQASVDEGKTISREDVLGWLSIILIYLAVGFLLALPFLVFTNKVLSWFVSNLFGVTWLFWYGFQLGKSVGKHKLILGFSMSAIGVAFLLLSYLAWT